MAELQSCVGGLVNACAALCTVRQEEGKGERMGDVEVLLAELKRERQKNAELLDRISALEAQVQIKDEKDQKSLSFAPPLNVNNGQVCCPASAEERSSKKLKRQKTESATEELGNINGRESTSRLSPSEQQHDADFISLQDSKVENGLVSWMSMDDTEVLPLNKCKDAESTIQCEDTDDSDDEDEPYSDDDADNYEILKDSCENMPVKFLEKTQDSQSEIDVASTSQKAEQDWGEAKKNVRSGNLSMQKKPPKVAFCPKEIRGILESDALALKNAQSHTMRKIIVFASLGTRHGCEDMYELDYNHFTILRKGEPYISPSNPGEHVLYENPGVKRKVFYPNRPNPALCPVQILEEEKAMRPSDASCPSCLFLCIKYGGRTRNIPQNEYVRQRMGRNKLKSFGPIICQIARLANIRTGSFFFKALGITLLFMAGFPDDIVQRETKYRNLDLLQKYYR